MSTKFQYDEEGKTFFYFLLSFEALVVIPCTYYFYPRASNRHEQKRDKSLCHCDNCRIKESRLRSQEPYRKAKERFIKFLIFIGWIAIFLTTYKIANVADEYVAYNPFEILQIDGEASMSEIKKAYRRLSLLYHPDRETGDAKQFMMIAKAYAALTDDESRKNWEMYGNPDGPQAMSFGIALPSWIVEKENSVWVLGLYALMFMVALPITVAVWWHRSRKFGGDQVLLATTELYLGYMYKTPHMVFKRVLMILAASVEFCKMYNGEIIERPSDNVEVPMLIKELPNLGEKNKEKPLTFGYSIKARALVHAHLSRMKLPPSTLDEDRLYIVKKCPYLLHEFVQCASQMTMLALAGRISRMPNLDTLEHAMKLCACIVQAIWDNRSPLMMLPHINEDMLRHFTTRKRNIRNIKQLAAMKSDDRRSLLRSLSDEEYCNVMNVLSKMPIIEVEVKSEVLDDEDSCITASAIVTVTATLIRKDTSTLLSNEGHETKEYVDDEPEPILEEIKKPKVWDKSKKKKGKGGKIKRKAPVAKQSANKKAENAENLKNGDVLRPQPKPEKSKKDVSDDSGPESDLDDDDSVSGNSAYEDNEGEKNKSENEGDDAEWEKFQSKVAKREKVLETKSKKSHSVHCPYFPDHKDEYWWIYLIDKKKHALITFPYLVTNLVTKEEVELKFTAPPRPGIYNFSVIVRSDSYIDCDVVKNIKLDVKEAKEVDLSKVQWDISEEEEEKDEEESAVEDSDLATDDEIDDD